MMGRVFVRFFMLGVTAILAPACGGGGGGGGVVLLPVLVSFGDNEFGQLGQRSALDASSAIGVPGVTTVASTIGGSGHSLALLQDGSVMAWGGNALGQLGDGSLIERSVPAPVSGLPVSPVTAVAAGSNHSLALHQDGSLSAWGWNPFGQLGDGTTAGRSTPVAVTGLPVSPVVAIACGAEHTVALHQDGSVSTWGRNQNGQLGDGTMTNRPAPVSVAGLPVSPVVGIAAGGWHTVVLHQDGSISAWGSNVSGQLGDGTTNGSMTPVTVVGLPVSPVLGVEAGANHTVAVHQDGTVSTWGWNLYGQLGDGTTTNRSSPVSVAGLPASPVTDIAAGYYHTAALHQDGSVTAWGRNEKAELGDGTTTDRLTPVTVTGLGGSPVVSIATGARHTLASRQDGSLSVWGHNLYGQLGDGATTMSVLPLPVSGLPVSPVSDVAAGLDYSVALHQNGRVTTWGWNLWGQLGDGTTTNRWTPAVVTGLPASPVVAVAAHLTHTAVLHEDGSLSAWGRNDFGELGDGTLVSSTIPVTVVGLPVSPVSAIAVGANHTLALHQDGTVSAWGSNSQGQLGDGTTTNRPTAVAVTGLPPAPVISIAASWNHSLALHQDGSLSAWGENLSGQLGDGTTISRSTPVAVSGLPASPVIAIDAGQFHSVAVHQDGSVSSWGSNVSGQLGDGTTTNRSSPVAVVGLPASPVVAISAGGGHTLALLEDSSVVGWGYNGQGQLGDGLIVIVSPPVFPVGLSDRTTAIAAGRWHSLVIH